MKMIFQVLCVWLFVSGILAQPTCLNGGTYNSTSAACVCLPGYSGVNCSAMTCSNPFFQCANTSTCTQSSTQNNATCTCYNGGTYTVTSTSGSCHCLNNYQGTSCSAFSCSNPASYCYNGGRCSNPNNELNSTCTCTNYYNTSSYCQTCISGYNTPGCLNAINYCSNNTTYNPDGYSHCALDSTCTYTGPASYTCSGLCPTGVTLPSGMTCKGISTVCYNNTVNDVSSYSCVCGPHNIGTQCDINIFLQLNTTATGTPRWWLPLRSNMQDSESHMELQTTSVLFNNVPHNGLLSGQSSGLALSSGLSYPMNDYGAENQQLVLNFPITYSFWLQPLSVPVGLGCPIGNTITNGLSNSLIIAYDKSMHVSVYVIDVTSKTFSLTTQMAMQVGFVYHIVAVAAFEVTTIMMWEYHPDSGLLTHHSIDSIAMDIQMYTLSYYALHSNSIYPAVGSAEPVIGSTAVGTCTNNATMWDLLMYQAALSPVQISNIYINSLVNLLVVDQCYPSNPCPYPYAYCSNTVNQSFTCACPGFTSGSCTGVSPCTAGSMYTASSATTYTCTQPCQNGGTYSGNGTSNACTCSGVYAGPQCQYSTCVNGTSACSQPQNYCTSNNSGGFSHCAVGSICTATGAGTYVCVGSCPVALVLPVGVTTSNTSTCINTTTNDVSVYSIQCSPGWAGNACQYKTCTNPALHCENGGVCVSATTSSNAYCGCVGQYQGVNCTQCIFGYYGSNCTIPENYCNTSNAAGRAHWNGVGSCTTTGPGTYQSVSTCPMQTTISTGVICPSTSSCTNTTTNDVSIYTCTCLDGWTGNKCQYRTCSNPATPICYNGGICVESTGTANATCQCTVNYAGASCQSCSSSYYGVNCSVPNNYCTTSNVGGYSHCAVDGSCTYTGAGSYSCVTNCAVGVQQADSTFCSNHSTCLNTTINDIISYTCPCTSSWTGSACQYKTCSNPDSRCSNGGTCIESIGTANATCNCIFPFSGPACSQCANGYYGSQCQPVNYCNSSNPDGYSHCPIGSTCNYTGPGMYSCNGTCIIGVTGADGHSCSLQSTQCLNQTINGHSSLTCGPCAPPYVGQLCNQRVFPTVNTSMSTPTWWLPLNTSMQDTENNLVDPSINGIYGSTPIFLPTNIFLYQQGLLMYNGYQYLLDDFTYEDRNGGMIYMTVPITISLWVQPLEVPTGHGCIIGANPYYDGYSVVSIAYDSSMQVTLSVSDNTGSSFAVTSSMVMIVGNAYHLVASVSAASGPGTISVSMSEYSSSNGLLTVNGLNRPQQNTATYYTSGQIESEKPTLGYMKSATGGCTNNMTVWDVLMYQNTLSATQSSNLYINGNSNTMVIGDVCNPTNPCVHPNLYCINNFNNTYNCACPGFANRTCVGPTPCSAGSYYTATSPTTYTCTNPCANNQQYIGNGTNIQCNCTGSYHGTLCQINTCAVTNSPGAVCPRDENYCTTSNSGGYSHCATGSTCQPTGPRTYSCESNTAVACPVDTVQPNGLPYPGHAVCYNSTNNDTSVYTYTCLPGWVGSACQYMDCNNPAFLPCQSGSTCIPSTGTADAFCNCTKQFTGPQCQNCITGFYGTGCAVPINFCTTSNPDGYSHCAHTSTCTVTESGTYSCVGSCSVETICGAQGTSCLNSTINDVSILTCGCVPPYGGLQCAQMQLPPVNTTMLIPRWYLPLISDMHDVQGNLLATDPYYFLDTSPVFTDTAAFVNRNGLQIYPGYVHTLVDPALENSGYPQLPDPFTLHFWMHPVVVFDGTACVIGSIPFTTGFNDLFIGYSSDMLLHFSVSDNSAKQFTVISPMRMSPMYAYRVVVSVSAPTGSFQMALSMWQYNINNSLLTVSGSNAPSYTTQSFYTSNTVITDFPTLGAVNSQQYTNNVTVWDLLMYQSVLTDKQVYQIYQNASQLLIGDVCTPNPCMVLLASGFCHNNLNNTFTCSCPGFSGSGVCSTAGVSPCVNKGVYTAVNTTVYRCSNPCLNGGIYTGDGTNIQCSCPVTYSGSVCQYYTCQNTAAIQCLNGGTCVSGNNQANSFCNCTSQYWGDQCASCLTGYFGSTCSTPINYCGNSLADNPAGYSLCPAAGTCTMTGSGSYSCVTTCPLGTLLSGSSLMCASSGTSTCINTTANINGTLNTVSSYSCVCKVHYTGKDCSILTFQVPNTTTAVPSWHLPFANQITDEQGNVNNVNVYSPATGTYVSQYMYEYNGVYTYYTPAVPVQFVPLHTAGNLQGQTGAVFISPQLALHVFANSMMDPTAGEMYAPFTWTLWIQPQSIPDPGNFGCVLGNTVSYLLMDLTYTSSMQPTWTVQAMSGMAAATVLVSPVVMQVNFTYHIVATVDVDGISLYVAEYQQSTGLQTVMGHNIASSQYASFGSPTQTYYLWYDEGPTLGYSTLKYPGVCSNNFLIFDLIMYRTKLGQNQVAHIYNNPDTWSNAPDMCHPIFPCQTSYSFCASYSNSTYQCACPGLLNGNCLSAVLPCSTGMMYTATSLTTYTCSNPCQNNGTYTGNGTDVQCSCHSGWSGVTCTAFTCANTDLAPGCQNGGSCVQPNLETNATCVCVPELGYSGPTCTDITSHYCTTGCASRCLPGYYGTNCSLPENYCTTNNTDGLPRCKPSDTCSFTGAGLYQCIGECTNSNICADTVSCLNTTVNGISTQQCYCPSTVSSISGNRVLNISSAIPYAYLSMNGSYSDIYGHMNTQNGPRSPSQYTCALNRGNIANQGLALYVANGTKYALPDYQGYQGSLSFPLTISVWVQPLQVPQQYAAVFGSNDSSLNDGQGATPGLYYDNTLHMNFGIYFGTSRGGLSYSITSPMQMIVNNVYHVVASWGGTTTSTLMLWMWEYNSITGLLTVHGPNVATYQTVVPFDAPQTESTSTNLIAPNIGFAPLPGPITNEYIMWDLVLYKNQLTLSQVANIYSNATKTILVGDMCYPNNPCPYSYQYCYNLPSNQYNCSCPGVAHCGDTTPCIGVGLYQATSPTTYKCMNPCFHGGVYSGDGNSTHCTCPLTFSGPLCQYRTCVNNTVCMNGGQCIQLSPGTSAATCSCPPHYLGSTCTQVLFQNLTDPHPSWRLRLSGNFEDTQHYLTTPSYFPATGPYSFIPAPVNTGNLLSADSVLYMGAGFEQRFDLGTTPYIAPVTMSFWLQPLSTPGTGWYGCPIGGENDGSQTHGISVFYGNDMRIQLQVMEGSLEFTAALTGSMVMKPSYVYHIVFSIGDKNSNAQSPMTLYMSEYNPDNGYMTIHGSNVPTVQTKMAPGDGFNVDSQTLTLGASGSTGNCANNLTLWDVLMYSVVLTSTQVNNIYQSPSTWVTVGDSCTPYPCMNDQPCVNNLDNTYTCNCSSLWSGTLCQYETCRQPRCAPTGTCTQPNPQADPFCVCDTGYMLGPNLDCAAPINRCSTDPMYNPFAPPPSVQLNICPTGLQCVFTGPGTYGCQCPTGTGGPTCTSPVWSTLNSSNPAPHTWFSFYQGAVADIMQVGTGNVSGTSNSKYFSAASSLKLPAPLTQTAGIGCVVPTAKVVPGYLATLTGGIQPIISGSFTLSMWFQGVFYQNAQSQTEHVLLSSSDLPGTANYISIRLSNNTQQSLYVQMCYVVNSQVQCISTVPTGSVQTSSSYAYHVTVVFNNTRNSVSNLYVTLTEYHTPSTQTVLCYTGTGILPTVSTYISINTNPPIPYTTSVANTDVVFQPAVLQLGNSNSNYMFNAWDLMVHNVSLTAVQLNTLYLATPAQTVYDWCTNNNCPSYSTGCVNNAGVNFTCTCIGFSNSDCSQINPCAATQQQYQLLTHTSWQCINPCANGGVYIGNNINTVCLCPNSWSGTTCSVPGWISLNTTTAVPAVQIPLVSATFVDAYSNSVIKSDNSGYKTGIVQTQAGLGSWNPVQLVSLPLQVVLNTPIVTNTTVSIWFQPVSSVVSTSILWTTSNSNNTHGIYGAEYRTDNGVIHVHVGYCSSNGVCVEQISTATIHLYNIVHVVHTISNNSTFMSLYVQTYDPVSGYAYNAAVVDTMQVISNIVVTLDHFSLGGQTGVNIWDFILYNTSLTNQLVTTMYSNSSVTTQAQNVCITNNPCSAHAVSCTLSPTGAAICACPGINDPTCSGVSPCAASNSMYSLLNNISYVCVNPCQNGGQYDPAADGYQVQCICPVQFGGKHCELQLWKALNSSLPEPLSWYPLQSTYEVLDATQNSYAVSNSILFDTSVYPGALQSTASIFSFQQHVVIYLLQQVTVPDLSVSVWFRLSSNTSAATPVAIWAIDNILSLTVSNNVLAVQVCTPRCTTYSSTVQVAVDEVVWCTVQVSNTQINILAWVYNAVSGYLTRPMQSFSVALPIPLSNQVISTVSLGDTDYVNTVGTAIWDLIMFNITLQIEQMQYIYMDNYPILNQLDPCVPNPCVGGTVCVHDSISTHSCVCPGYNNTRCTGTNPCNSIGLYTVLNSTAYTCNNPCVSSAVYNGTGLDTQCVCQTGYSGPYCSITTCNLPGFTCLNGGTCTQANPNVNAVCECPVGYSGTNCQYPTCANPVIQCDSHHVCTQNNNNTAAACTCPAGFSGTNCASQTCDRVQSTCLHQSTCVQTDINQDAVCSCAGTAYTGKHCETLTCCTSPGCTNPLLSCSSVYGQCYDDGQQQNATCVCIPGNGYYGSTCTTECLYGNYTTNNGKDVCICDNTAVGPTCSTRVDPCLIPGYNQCQHSSQCIASNLGKDLSYSCVCPNGWSGTFCETWVTPCHSAVYNTSSTRCINGGACIPINQQVDQSFSCSCPLGWNGTTCAVWQSPCINSNYLQSTQKCQNGGICLATAPNINQSYTCACSTGYSGALCTVAAPACSLLPPPCLPGAQCISGDTPTDYTCILPQPNTTSTQQILLTVNATQQYATLNASSPVGSVLFQQAFIEYIATATGASSDQITVLQLHPDLVISTNIHVARVYSSQSHQTNSMLLQSGNTLVDISIQPSQVSATAPSPGDILYSMYTTMQLLYQGQLAQNGYQYLSNIVQYNVAPYTKTVNTPGDNSNSNSSNIAGYNTTTNILVGVVTPLVVFAVSLLGYVTNKYYCLQRTHNSKIIHTKK